MIEDAGFSSAQVAEQVYQCFEQGDLQGAIAHLDAAIQSQPNHAYFYTERAGFRARLEDFVGAIADYSDAIALSPKTALFYTWRGRIYRKIGNESAAIADFLKASALHRD